MHANKLATCGKCGRVRQTRTERSLESRLILGCAHCGQVTQHTLTGLAPLNAPRTGVPFVDLANDVRHHTQGMKP